MEPVRIVLADDHHVVRQGLRRLLEAEVRCTIVAEAGDGLAAVAEVERLKPDVLVVDLMMPLLSGLEVIRRVRQRAPQTRIVVLSMHADEPYVCAALRAGATSYVLKEARPSEFVAAVRDSAAGQRYLSPILADRVIDAYLQQGGETLEPYEMLTEREREVLSMVAQGHTTTEIATILSLGARTVETYRASLMRKLNLRNQTDLIRYALRQGLITLDS